MRHALSLFAVLIVSLAAQAADQSQSGQIRALIVDGQNNHAWRTTTPILKAALESSGRFTVDVATSPPHGRDMSSFHPDFARYGVVISNYNGDDWPADTRRAFEDYVHHGGGFVSVHAADNAFPHWKEYNRMIGVGGWGGRNDSSGPMLRWRGGQVVRDHKGGGGTHGKYFSFVVTTRNANHPITRGLPAHWLHTPDELYSTLVGPAEHVTVLATAQSDVTHQNEPMLMAIQYGKGRVFHTTLGHSAESMKDVGFVTTLNRGAEWAATGKVTIPVPANFPSADHLSRWEPQAQTRADDWKTLRAACWVNHKPGAAWAKLPEAFKKAYGNNGWKKVAVRFYEAPRTLKLPGSSHRADIEYTATGKPETYPTFRNVQFTLQDDKDARYLSFKGHAGVAYKVRYSFHDGVLSLQGTCFFLNPQFATPTILDGDFVPVKVSRK